MGNGFRKGLTSYGDDEFSYFLRRGFLKAAGYTDADLHRPVVGIATSASDFNPCHATVPALTEAVKRGVQLAGGIPMAFPSISLHESFSYPTSMMYRNLMAMDIEEMIGAQPMDAVVLIGGCDKTVPAQLMGAVSAGVPAISLVVGPMLTGHYEGERLGACTDCRRLWASHRAGDMDADELARAGDHLMSTHGTCMVMGTASTMACLAETLGFMLPGGASIPAVHSERIRFAELTGQRATEMARNHGPLPSEFVTEVALHNAMTVLQALGGSTNALIHLAAIAGRAGIQVDLETFDEIGRQIPVIVDLKPSGLQYMEDFHAAGGLPAVWRQLGSLLHTEAHNVSGRTIAEEIEAAPAFVDTDIIRRMETPVYPRGAMAILRGSLAPQGAVIKLSATSGELLQHEGPALVFDSLEDLAARIDDPELPVTADHILVLRKAGPVGAPGMPEAGGFPIPRKLARAGIRDMVRISDARMSGTAYGTVVLHVSPEAAVGGPLALVEDGDKVRLDVKGRRIDLLIDEAELAVRRERWKPTVLPERGYARLFIRSVMQAESGCDFDFLCSHGSKANHEDSPRSTN